MERDPADVREKPIRRQGVERYGRRDWKVGDGEVAHQELLGGGVDPVQAADAGLGGGFGALGEVGVGDETAVAEHAGKVDQVFRRRGFEVELAGVGEVAEAAVAIGLDVVEEEVGGIFPERGPVGQRVADGDEGVLKGRVLDRAAPVGDALRPASVVPAPHRETVAVESVGETPPVPRLRWQVVPQGERVQAGHGHEADGVGGGFALEGVAADFLDAALADPRGRLHAARTEMGNDESALGGRETVPEEIVGEREFPPEAEVRLVVVEDRGGADGGTFFPAGGIEAPDAGLQDELLRFREVAFVAGAEPEQGARVGDAGDPAARILGGAPAVGLCGIALRGFGVAVGEGLGREGEAEVVLVEVGADFLEADLAVAGGHVGAEGVGPACEHESARCGGGDERGGVDLGAAKGRGGAQDQGEEQKGQTRGHG